MFNNSSPYGGGEGGGGGGGGGGTPQRFGSAFEKPSIPLSEQGGQHHRSNANGNPFQTFGNADDDSRCVGTTPGRTEMHHQPSSSRQMGHQGGGGGGGGGSLFTSSPAPAMRATPFGQHESAPPVGTVFQRHPSGVNLGYYEPTARAFADGHAQIPSPRKESTTYGTHERGGHGVGEHAVPKFSSMLFSSTQRGAGLNPQKLESPAANKDNDLFADSRRKEMSEREVNFGNVNAKGMPLFTRDAGKAGTAGNRVRRTSIGSRGGATTEEREKMNNEERSKAGAAATTTSLGTAYATRNDDVDANDPAAVEAALASVQTPCWVTVFGFTNDDATFVLSKLQKIGDVVNFGQFLPPNDEDEDTFEDSYENDFAARRKLEESPSRKKSPFSRKADMNGFSPRKYHGSPTYTRKFGSHSAIGSANWLHVKFQKPEFAKRALQLNGTRISDRIMIGVKPLSEKDARYIGGVCDDVDGFGSNKRNSIDRSPRRAGNKRTMLNGSASVALQPRRGTWNKVVEFVFGT